jgi:hypothetical protein
MRLLERSEIVDTSLSAEQAANIISKQCQPFLNEIGDIDTHQFFRGTRIRFSPNVVIQEPRVDRRPLTNTRSAHDAADSFFFDEFGIKFRSQALFCSGLEEIAKIYGDVYIVFPIGKFDFCWTEEFTDMFLFLRKELILKKQEHLSDKEQAEYLRSLLEVTEFHFNDNSFGKYFGSGFRRHEMMIKCQEVLLIKKEFWPSVSKLLK